MDEYAIINETTGKVVNICVWDGKSEWHPGPDFSVRVATQSDRAELTKAMAQNETE